MVAFQKYSSVSGISGLFFGLIILILVSSISVDSAYGLSTVSGAGGYTPLTSVGSGSSVMTFDAPLTYAHDSDNVAMEVIGYELRSSNSVNLTFTDGRSAIFPSDAIVSLAASSSSQPALLSIMSASNDDLKFIRTRNGWLQIQKVEFIQCPKIDYRNIMLNRPSSDVAEPRMIALMDNNIEIHAMVGVSDEFVWTQSMGQTNRLIDFPSSGKISLAGPAGRSDHDYFCFDDGIMPMIAECCGSDGCNTQAQSGAGSDSWGGMIRRTGYSINHVGQVFYCRSDGTFSTGLDDIYSFDPDGNSCKEARYPDETGTLQDLQWTGTLCCGEADNPHEYYNDPEGNGICWDSEYMPNNKLVKINGFDRAELLVHNGSVYGCNIDGLGAGNESDDEDSESVYEEFEISNGESEDSDGNNVTGNPLLEIMDSHVCGPVVTNVPMCELKISEGGQNHFCTSYGIWMPTSASEIHTKAAAWDASSRGGVTSSCCAADQCWDGFECRKNQFDDFTLTVYPVSRQEGEAAYRCVDGEWNKAVLKVNYENSEVGFCGDEGQCLVTMQSPNPLNNDNPDMFYSQTGKPMCVSDGHYFEDYYCEGGQWTTRTRHIATSLIQKAAQESPNAYTLHCGPHQEVLPDYEGKVVEVCDRNGYRTSCINNMCVLSYGDEIIVGTSYNVPLDSSLLANDPISKECQGRVLSGTGFISCSPRNIAYFDPSIESIVFDRFAISRMYAPENRYERFRAFLGNRIGMVLGYIKNTMNPTREVFGSSERINVSLVDKETHFNEIYIAKRGQQEVVAIRGSVPDVPKEPRQIRDLGLFDFIAVQFNGFPGTDVCSYIDTYMERFYLEHGSTPRAFESMSCSKQGNAYYVFSKDKISDDIWLDLTSKISI